MTEPAKRRANTDSQKILVRAGSSSLCSVSDPSGLMARQVSDPSGLKARPGSASAVAGALWPRFAPSGASQESGVRVRLLIVRHAQSANKAIDKKAGQKAAQDPELTDLGYDQAYALSERMRRDFPPEVLSRTPLTVISSPMRRCLLTILPTVQRLKLGKDNCLCHGGFYEFGCTGLDKRTSTPSDITYEFPEFSPTGFSASGQWDYRGSNLKETEQEHKERGLRLVEWLQNEAAASLRARCTGTDCPTILLAIHQSLADLLLQILVEGTAEKWSYGEIENKVTNASFTEVFLYANGSASLGVSNDDRHHQSRRYSTMAAKTAPQFRSQKTCVF
jgi:broad specificity phosphatase PhoE